MLSFSDTEDSGLAEKRERARLGMIEYRKRLKVIRESRRARIAELESRESDLNQDELEELSELQTEDKNEWKKRRVAPESRQRAPAQRRAKPALPRQWYDFAHSKKSSVPEKYI